VPKVFFFRLSNYELGSGADVLTNGSYLTVGWGLPSVTQGRTADWSFLAVIVAILSMALGALAIRESARQKTHSFNKQLVNCFYGARSLH